MAVIDQSSNKLTKRFKTRSKKKIFTQNKEQHLAAQQQKYSSCLKAVGGGHIHVPFVERGEQRISDLQAAAHHTASVRGISALRVQQSKEKEMTASKTKNLQKKQEVRAKENERAATIASLPTPIPDPISKAFSGKGIPPVFRSRSDEGEIVRPKLVAHLLPSVASNVASPRSPFVPRNRYSTKIDKAQTAESLCATNIKKTLYPERNQLREQLGLVVNDNLAKKKMDVSFGSQRQGRKFKGYVCKKINKRKSIGKRRSLAKSSFTQPKELSEPFNTQLPLTPKVVTATPSKSTSDNHATALVPQFPADCLLIEPPDKDFDDKVLTGSAKVKPVLQMESPEKVEIIEQNVNCFDVVQEDLNFLQDCENLMKELATDEQVECHRHKIESVSLSNDVNLPAAADKRQLLMEKAIEDVMIGVVSKTGVCETSPYEPSYQRTLPLDCTANAGSPHGNEAASILNTCRIEEESVNSSPDMAFCRNLQPHHETRHYFPSVFLDDLMLQPAPDSVTTSRRKFVDAKKHEKSAEKSQITITTAIQKDRSEDSQDNGLSIKTTVKQSSSLLPAVLKPSEESQFCPRSVDLKPPYLTRSPQVQIKNSVSAYQQYVKAQSDKISLNAPKMTELQDFNTMNAVQLKTRLVHITEQLKTSDVCHPAGCCSKSLQYEHGVNVKGKTEERMLTEKESLAVSTAHLPQTIHNIVLSPEYTHVTPADTRLALARVLASRRTPVKTENVATPSTSEPTVAKPSTRETNCTDTNSLTNVQSTTTSSIVMKKPTWNEVFKSSENVAKQTTAIQISDAKVRQCQSEIQKIVEEEEELFSQLMQLRHSQQEDNLEANRLPEGQQHPREIVLSYNNFGTNQLFVEGRTLCGINSPDNNRLSDGSNVSFSPSPEFYVRARPPATLPRGMDRTPHELSTIWEADTPRSIPTSFVIEGNAPTKSHVAPPYFYKTKLQKQTGLSQTGFFPRDPFLAAELSTPSPPQATTAESTPLASTPKKAMRISISLQEDGPGIMEQSEISLVDSESASTTGLFTPPDFSPSKLIGLGNLRFPHRHSISRLAPDSQGPSPDYTPANIRNNVHLAKWQIGREQKSSPLTPKTSENSISESLLSFERHELSSGSPDGLSPVQA